MTFRLAVIAAALTLSIALTLALAAGGARAAPLTVQLLGADGKPVPDAAVGALLRGAHSMAGAAASAQISQKERHSSPPSP